MKIRTLKSVCSLKMSIFKKHVTLFANICNDSEILHLWTKDTVDKMLSVHS